MASPIIAVRLRRVEPAPFGNPPSGQPGALMANRPARVTTRPTRSAAARPAISPRPGITIRPSAHSFKRLASDGITAQNTEFVFSSDEGDHEAGGKVGRAVQPTPANCDGVTVVCTYPNGSFGELEANVTGLLAGKTGDTTPFGMEFDTAPEFYVNGQPGPDTSGVRQFEHDLASLTAYNPYAGSTQKIALPGRPGRGSHPAHGQRRPGPYAHGVRPRQT
jgi:hypothetical protein